MCFKVFRSVLVFHDSLALLGDIYVGVFNSRGICTGAWALLSLVDQSNIILICFKKKKARLREESSSPVFIGRARTDLRRALDLFIQFGIRYMRKKRLKKIKV